MPSNTSEQRHLRTGSLNIPSQNGHGQPKGPANAGIASQRGGLDSRSPPNTSHVPCKFFRQSTCQAGSACPFSHDLHSASDTVCKYFSKGNCKFGPKCANIHMLPDGRRINYNKNGFTFSQSSIPLGNRVNPNTYNQASNSALTNSFLRAGDAPPYAGPGAFGGPGDGYTHQLTHQPSLENGIPTIDTTYSSNPASAYGSPRDEDSNRFGFGLSPPMHNGLSVLDAPLPASFDPNGISHAARYGPWPSSVPTKFGIDSPSSSLHSAKADRTSETLKLLHTSAFGSSDHLSPSGLTAVDMGSSPPMTTASDEYFGKRTLHSSSLRYAKPRLMSSSAPKVDRDWENEFLFEEDYVPGELAGELLTPQEKARRGSMRMTDAELSDTASSSLPKFGSPSRWGPSIPRQRDDNDLGSLGRSMRQVSAFGHVGSPLRNSSLAIDMESNGSFGRTARGGDEGMSALTQQLRGSRLSDDLSGSPSSHLHPNAARGGLGSGVGIIGKEREREKGLERHFSSGSIGSSATGRYPTPIDEEDSPFVFAMEEVDDAASRNRKRRSGGWGMSSGPTSAGGFTYASIAGGKNGKPITRAPGTAERVSGR